MPRPDLCVGAAFALAHPDEAAGVLETVPPESAAAFLAEMLAERAAPIVARMGPVSAAGTLAALERSSAVQLLERLPPPAAARIARQLPDPGPLLDDLPPALGAAVRRLLSFPEGSAGAVADPSVLTVPEDTTGGDARRMLSREPRRVFLFLYVVDRSDRLVGVLDLRDLMAAPAGETVAAIMRADPARLPARADLRSLAVDPAWLTHEALPVVDEAETFLGVLHHRILRQLAQSAADPAGALSPFVGLAELYWTGFSRVLFGAGAAAAATSAPEGYRDAG